jgi:hypothetical protein
MRLLSFFVLILHRDLDSNCHLLHHKYRLEHRLSFSPLHRHLDLNSLLLHRDLDLNSDFYAPAEFFVLILNRDLDSWSLFLQGDLDSNFAFPSLLACRLWEIVTQRSCLGEHLSTVHREKSGNRCFLWTVVVIRHRWLTFCRLNQKISF